MQKRLLSLLLSIISIATVSAHDFEDEVLTSPPSSFLRTADNSSSQIATVCGSTTNNSFVLPIVFWVVMKNSRDTLVSRVQIDSARVWLNRDFANSAGFFPSTDMSFDFAKRDPNGNPTTGINYVDGSILPAYSTYGINVVTNSTGFSAYEFGNYGFTWDHNRYINVYIVDSIYNGYGGVATNIPSFFGEGVFIKASQFKLNAHTVSHEMGHYFNLKHTFEGQWTNGTSWQCPLNDNCATQGDGICDTPPHRSQDWNSSPCYSGSDFLNSGHNFMSYGGILDDRFTAGQTTKMRDYLFNTRSGLISSEALVPTSTALEIALDSVYNDTTEYFCRTFIPKVSIRNIGTTNLSNCKVQLYVDGVLSQTTFLGSLSLVKDSSKVISLNASPITTGSHTITLTLSEINGSATDFFLLNNSLCKQINFQNKTLTVTTTGQNGTTSGDGDFLCESSITVSATPEYCYTFKNWTENGTIVSTNANYSFSVTGARNLVANFTQNRFSISLAPNDVNKGTVTGNGTYGCDTSVTVRANVKSGSRWLNWTEGGTVVSTDSVYTFMAAANRTLVANFEQIITGIKQTAINEITRIYPNPANSILQLEINSKKSTKLNLNIVDIRGKTVDTKVLNNNKGISNTTFDVSKLAKGYYFLNLSDEDGFVSYPFVVQ